MTVRNGTISQVAKVEEDVPDAAATIDGRGKFLIPGLWDMHVHLSTRPEPQLAERVMLPAFLAYGVIGVRDMGGPLARVLELRDQVNKGALAGPRILTPGPFIDGPGEADPMFRRATNAAEGREAVRELVKAGVDFVKVQANLTKETYDAVMDEAKSRKAVVAGHVPVALPLADVIRANQRSIEHVSPALVGDAGVLFACSSREADLRKELLAIERERATLKPEEVRARETALRAELVKTFDSERARAIGRGPAGGPGGTGPGFCRPAVARSRCPPAASSAVVPEVHPVPRSLPGVPALLRLGGGAVVVAEVDLAPVGPRCRRLRLLALLDGVGARRGRDGLVAAGGEAEDRRSGDRGGEGPADGGGVGVHGGCPFRCPDPFWIRRWDNRQPAAGGVDSC